MQKMLRITGLLFFAILILVEPSLEYPVDGYAESGIRRLERLRIRIDDSLRGFVPPKGGQKSINEIRLNFVDTTVAFRDSTPEPLAMLLDPLSQAPAAKPVHPPRLRLKNAADTLYSTLGIFPRANKELQQRLNALFANRDRSYSLALLEITPGQAPRYGGVREHLQYSPGSVGKLAIAVGIFEELSRLFPGDIEARKQLLRERMIVAENWIHHDDHGVPFYDIASGISAFRPIKEGDVFSLWEWIDHMISPSSNAAASTVWKEAMLIRHFGEHYPPSKEEENAFFDTTPKSVLSEMALSIVNDPLRRIGIAEADWRLGSFFTNTGQRRVPGGGGSFATPRGLLLFLLRLEQGRVIDEWSSLEIKRLMYMTEKRIRYASAPRLSDCAVYFKSGSLYRCQPEPGFQCGKYKGNRDNYMNSVAIVERQDGKSYLVALMSNVLRINSAVEHQTLATYIDRIIDQ